MVINANNPGVGFAELIDVVVVGSLSGGTLLGGWKATVWVTGSLLCGVMCSATANTSARCR